MADTGGTCASCGRPMHPGSPYCEHCGARAPEAPSALPKAPSPLTQRGFLRSLFDLSFTSLIATRIIKVLYVLSMLAIGLSALVFIIAAFHQSRGAGIVVLIFVAPLVSLFYLVWTRVLLELFIALFRIMENTSELVAQGRREGSA